MQTNIFNQWFFAWVFFFNFIKLALNTLLHNMGSFSRGDCGNKASSHKNETDRKYVRVTLLLKMSHR